MKSVERADRINIGLEGVVVAETRLSMVDGEGGRLLLGGRPVEEVAARGRFEDAVALLLDGRFPEAERWEEVRRGLAEGRRTAYARLAALGDALAAKDGMDALRAATAHLPEETEPLLLTGALAVFTAAWMARKNGSEIIPPDPGAEHAVDLLTMLRGAPPAREEARAFAAYLSTVVDHGMNASTFTARVIASTGSDLVSAVVGALGALKGPLHGGAPGPVLDMLDAVESPENARRWVDAELAAKRRIMGMGHRVYRVRDPRAAVLETAVVALAGDTERLRLARALEEAARAALATRHPDRPMQANVELYTALILEALRIPRSGFTMIFACARVAGWCAHVIEQRQRGRLMRPKARYVSSVG